MHFSVGSINSESFIVYFLTSNILSRESSSLKTQINVFYGMSVLKFSSFLEIILASLISLLI